MIPYRGHFWHIWPNQNIGEYLELEYSTRKPTNSLTRSTNFIIFLFFFSRDWEIPKREKIICDILQISCATHHLCQIEVLLGAFLENSKTILKKEIFTKIKIKKRNEENFFLSDCYLLPFSSILSIGYI